MIRAAPWPGSWIRSPRPLRPPSSSASRPAILGRLRVGSIEPGGICGPLIVALLIRQTGVRLDEGVKDVAFALFIFALGFGAAPQFFANRTIDSWRVALLALIEVVTAVTLVLLGAGIVAGTLIGRITLPVGGVSISLGIGGGCLVSGLVAGWWRARRSTGGSLPPAAVALLEDFGLAAFIAVFGLSAGAHAIELILRYGVALPITGIAISLVPALISLFVGRYLLRLDVPVLIGGIARQQASTPAITAIVNQAGNSTPLLGYTVTYALANVLLPLAGPLVVTLADLVGAP